jgi:Icc-related predicted phosphoesterase
MKIDCIGDLHGYYPNLQGGDLLIVCGDLTARDLMEEHFAFMKWLNLQNYDKKIFIGGNHDGFLSINKYISIDNSIKYLFDSGTVYKDLRIWGSPWTLKFYGMNPLCMAFTCDTEEELNEKWKLIPDDIDILITHSPCYGILDKVNMKQRNVGSSTLKDHVISRIKPKLHVCGHIHDAYGIVDLNEIKHVNCSHVNEYYDAVNDPIRVIL